MCDRLQDKLASPEFLEQLITKDNPPLSNVIPTAGSVPTNSWSHKNNVVFSFIDTYVVTLLDQRPIFDWSMAGLVVIKGHQNDEIIICAQNMIPSLYN